MKGRDQGVAVAPGSRADRPALRAPVRHRAPPGTSSIRQPRTGAVHRGRCRSLCFRAELRPNARPLERLRDQPGQSAPLPFDHLAVAANIVGPVDDPGAQVLARRTDPPGAVCSTHGRHRPRSRPAERPEPRARRGGHQDQGEGDADQEQRTGAERRDCAGGPSPWLPSSDPRRWVIRTSQAPPSRSGSVERPRRARSPGGETTPLVAVVQSEARSVAVAHGVPGTVAFAAPGTRCPLPRMGWWTRALERLPGRERPGAGTGPDTSVTETR